MLQYLPTLTSDRYITMNKLILLGCIGVCVAQSPSNAYLPWTGEPQPSQQGSFASPEQYRSSAHENHNTYGTLDNQYSVTDNQVSDLRGLLGSISRSGGALLNNVPSTAVPLQDPRVALRYNASPVQNTAQIRGNNAEINQNRDGRMRPSNSRSDTILPQISLPQTRSNQVSPNYINVQLVRGTPVQQYQAPRLGSAAQAYLIGASSPNYGLPLVRSANSDYGSIQLGYPTNQNEYIQQNAQISSGLTSYGFNYDVSAIENGAPVAFAHEEQRANDQAQGRYSVLLPDGQTQIVEYTADQEGYRPRVSYTNGHYVENSFAGVPHADGNVYESYDTETIVAARSYPTVNRQTNNQQSSVPRATSRSGPLNN